MIGKAAISLLGVTFLIAGSAIAQDRLGFVHNDVTVSGIVGNMRDLSAAEAGICKKAEDTIVQSCKFYEDCESDIQSVYDARVGADYFDDRFIVFDVFEVLTSSGDNSADNSEFLRKLGLDPNAYEGRIIQTASSFDIELAKVNRTEFDRAMTRHKICLSKVYEAAVSLSGQAEAEVVRDE